MTRRGNGEKGRQKTVRNEIRPFQEGSPRKDEGAEKILRQTC